MKPKLSDLWRCDGPVDRGTYAFWGVTLLALKFPLDYVLLDQPWPLFSRRIFGLYLWQSIPGEPNDRHYLLLLAFSLPFVWAGVALTLRRLRSIGWALWWVLLFFVPLLKLVFFVLLCLVPARGSELRQGPPPEATRLAERIGAFIPRSRWGSALLALTITGLSALGLIWLSANLLGNYGWSMFVALPFAAGLVAVLIYGFHERRALGPCLGVASGTVMLAALGLLVVALEGLVCIVMAAPIGLAFGCIGGAVGHMIQKTFRWRDDSPHLFGLAFLGLPALMATEHALPPAAPLREVKSSVIVAAPPLQVWRNVIAFPELPPPREFIFRFGVACPLRAEIQGHGPGALRHCVFSTGTFVEPIEVWDEPRLLRFFVTQSPPVMREWSPYSHLHPPHLNGYLESRAGQFRLVPLDDERTLLEGSTYYRQRMWPAAYWHFWSDEIIHRIHLRVLNHVKSLSESAR